MKKIGLASLAPIIIIANSKRKPNRDYRKLKIDENTNLAVIFFSYFKTCCLQAVFAENNLVNMVRYPIQPIVNETNRKRYCVSK